MTIDDIGRTNCSGCSLCSLLCPKHSIKMKPDAEGFLQPVIDKNTCIDCGRCYNNCPHISKYEKHESPIYYVSAIKNKEILQKSSSGGDFFALAEEFIKKGGYVCGCVFDDRMRAIHICTSEINDVYKMMGSKYVQSNITDCLLKVKQIIEDGKRVLFTGTACQIAAVKQYINCNDLLYTVDILCHGVPSPLFLSKYVDFLERKHEGRLIKLEFRNKLELGWGSEHRTYYEIETVKGKIGYRPNLPAYFCAFFWALNLRESCYNCKYAGKDRISDITIGDFWGYWSCFKKNFPEGISIASINTCKGRELFDSIGEELDYQIEIPQDKATATNTNFNHPTPRPSTRDGFYHNIENMRYEQFRKRVFFDKTSKKKLMTSIYGRFIPESVKRFIRTKFR